MNRVIACSAAVGIFLFGGKCPVLGSNLRFLHGHVPPVVRYLKSKGLFPATNELHLAIGLPLRNEAALDVFLQQLYDPASTNYHQFLTPAEFTTRFGPTEADYQKVIHFARASGFAITATHGNRLLLDVTAPAGAIDKAFHITLRIYRHPTEARNFYAPDTEPMVDAALPVADIEGLSDYSRPHPKLKRLNLTEVRPNSGSGSGGSYFGNDFRHAYAPGTTLTGAGQMVGLVQFDGFYSNDIAAYAAAAGNGRTNIAIQTVLLDGYDGTPTTGANSGNGEVSLDIEMAMAMAPGLAKIIVFEAGPSGTPNDVLNAMAASNTVKNLSCSWGWSGGPSTTTDAIFQQMAAQGQSFFNASGDSDAFTPGANSFNGVDNPGLQNAPSSSPYITQVGGTTLTTGASASYSSETVWNWGGGTGSSGGISSYYSIPSWQQGVCMTNNGGSVTQRNIPDVALTADNVYVISGGSGTGSGGWGGTSCAAPLWAGFMALVNQQAINDGQPSVGFVNPALYEIANESIYSSVFHDTTTGNNTWSSSPNQFYAASGYDLCTGFGTPAGTNLINALVNPDTLVVAANYGFTATGPFDGSFDVTSQTFFLTNAGSGSLDWSVVNTSAWLNVSSGGGTLAAGANASVTVSLNSAAGSLAVGNYTAGIWFSNEVTQIGHLRRFTLQITDPLALLHTTGFAAYGPAGGPFSPDSQTVVLTNMGASVLSWGLINTSAWLSVSTATGSLSGHGSMAATVFLNSSATGLANGIYTTTLVLSNQSANASQNLVSSVFVGQSLVQNGGFETGDFTGWTLNGNTTDGTYIYNAVESTAYFPDVVHSGNYGAFLGDTQVALLSQSLPTMPGQTYLLSFWLDNPVSGSPQQFLVNWNTNNAGTNQIFYLNNPPVLPWTNLTFFVTAAGTNTTLQFGAENPPNYFGLDDISLKPVPMPSFTALMGKASAFAFTWNSLAGVSYLIQYKTNLLQANWITLSTNTATAGTTSFTNVIGADARRFYRIRQLP